MCRHRWVVCAAAVLAGVSVAPEAAAQEAEDGDLRLMQEPTSYTDVIDAFDDDDPFDLNIGLGFRFEKTRGTIQREYRDENTLRRGSVAEWEHTRHILDLNLDVGLYEDVALFVNMPVILSDDRSLRHADLGSEADHDALLTDPDGMGGQEQLFQLPFDSPTRSGLDHIGVGLAWAIMNQFRDPHLPTWLVMVEGLFNLGDELNACNDNARYDDNPTYTGDGEPDGKYDTKCNGGDDPGISRGTVGLRAQTRASRRFRVAEPYMGLMFEIEWPGRADDLFAPAGDIDGFMNTMPPIEGEITFGVAFVPWERKDRYQRLSIDLRGSARYISEGRDYSPLFDALGTSPSTQLRQPNYEGIPPDQGRPTHYFGLSDVQAHGRYGGRVLVDIRAARYVEFVLGAGLFYTTPHMITFTDACNPNASTNDPTGTGRRGKCSSGIINPHHRPGVDLPGQRFQLNGAWTVDFQASALARF